MGVDEPLVAANRLLRVIQGTHRGDELEGKETVPRPVPPIRTAGEQGGKRPEGVGEERAQPVSEEPGCSDKEGGWPTRWLRGVRGMVTRGRLCLGVDVGTRAVKVVLARQRPSGSRILAWAARELSEADEGGSEDVDRAGRILRELIDSLGKRDAQKVYAVVSGPDVHLCRALFPRMPEKELKQAVRWECKKHVPFPVEEVILDYQVVGEAPERGGIKLDVVVALARREFVESRLAVFHKAGVGVHGLLAVPFALGNVVRSLAVECGAQNEKSDIRHPASEMEAEEGLAVIDLGATSSRIAFFESSGEMTLSRDIAVGGDDLTDAVGGALRSLQSSSLANPEQAEAFKRRHGIPRYDELEGNGEGGVLSKVSVMMRPVLERLLKEIQRSIQYYHTRFDRSEVNRLLLCGGGARLWGLDRYLEDGLGMTVRVLDPLRAVGVDGARPQEGDPALSVAVGLALGSGKEPNLLPNRIKRQHREIVDRMVMRTTAVAAGLGLSTFSLLGMLEKQQLTHVLSVLDGQWAQLQPVMEEQKRTQKEIREVEDLLSGLQGDGTTMLWILKELSHIVPTQVMLSELTIEGAKGPKERPKRIVLGGQIQGDRLLLESYLMEFMMALEGSGFTRPTLSSKRVIASEEGVELAFRLSCGLP